MLLLEKSADLDRRVGLVQPMAPQPMPPQPVARHLPQVRPNQGGYDVAAIVAMALIHVLGCAAIWLFAPTLTLAAVCIGSYYLRMFAITAGYHRYFAHRTFRTSRPFQFLLALLGGASAQRGALWWAAHHRDHHRHSDQPADIHSPLQRGFWWAHIGWIVHTSSTPTSWGNIRDFSKYPELVWLNNYELAPPIAYAAALLAMGGPAWLFWGFFLSTTLLWHGTFVINSLCHVWGSRRFVTGDTSRNNLWLALLTLGEGWHNNHHHFQSSARQGWLWWEVDGSYYALVALRKLGLVSHLKGVPDRVWQAQPGTPIETLDAAPLATPGLTAATP